MSYSPSRRKYKAGKVIYYKSGSVSIERCVLFIGYGMSGGNVR